MQEIDIENELKNSADKITVKSYSKRRDNIKDRIFPDGNGREVSAADAVLATSVGTVAGNPVSKKRNIFIAVLSLVLGCILTLAIVLPLTLNKSEPTYLDPGELKNNIVDQGQFYEQVDKAGLEIVDLSAYELYSFLIITPILNEDEVKGGSVTGYGDRFNIDVSFYDKTVVMPAEYLKYKGRYYVGGTEIYYETEFGEEVYDTKAFVRYKDISYVIRYISLDDDVSDVFENLFA